MQERIQLLAGYFRLMGMNAAARVYREAVRSGIFDALQGGRKSAAEVARGCQTSEEPTALVLDALATLDLVASEGGKYTLTPLAQVLLSGTSRDLDDRNWTYLPIFLKTGRPLSSIDDGPRTDGHYQTQAAILGWMHAPAAEAAAQLLGVGKTLRDLSIVDVGAGSAVWSLTMARNDLGTVVTAVDRPTVLPVAADSAFHFGVAERFNVIEGDYHSVALPAEAFDLAILGNVVHREVPESNRAIFEKIRRALKPDGRLAIFDVFAGDAAGDMNRAFYALSLAMRSDQSHFYSRRELESLLRETGFSPTSLEFLQAPPQSIAMLLASRA